jgi:hypothetical protein
MPQDGGPLQLTRVNSVIEQMMRRNHQIEIFPQFEDRINEQRSKVFLVA